MDRIRPVTDLVRFNYHTGKSKYFIMTGKTGYPSAEFRFRGSGMIVPHHKNSSADLP